MATYSTIILMPTTILHACKISWNKKQRQIQPGNKLMVIIRSYVFRKRHKWMDAALNKASLSVQSSFNPAQLNGKQACIHSVQLVDWTAWLNHCSYWHLNYKSWWIKGLNWDWIFSFCRLFWKWKGMTEAWGLVLSAVFGNNNAVFAS